MWAFGGPMVVDKSGDHRKAFNETFASAFGQKFPKDKPCFDYMWSMQVSTVAVRYITNIIIGG